MYGKTWTFTTAGMFESSEMLDMTRTYKRIIRY
jgi:hypothetical protein